MWWIIHIFLFFPLAIIPKEEFSFNKNAVPLNKTKTSTIHTGLYKHSIKVAIKCMKLKVYTSHFASEISYDTIKLYKSKSLFGPINGKIDFLERHLLSLLLYLLKIHPVYKKYRGRGWPGSSQDTWGKVRSLWGEKMASFLLLEVLFCPMIRHGTEKKIDPTFRKYRRWDLQKK